MTKENKDEITLTPAEDNLWYWLAQQAIKQDAISPEPDGWHWLILLHYVLGFNVADVQKKLPDENSLKSAPLPSDGTRDGFKPIIDEFRQKAGIPAGIRKEIIAIDFSKLIFNETADFSNFIFPINVDFESTTFSEQAIFTKAVFLNRTNFSNTNFSKEAGFENALFTVMGNFYMSTFFGNVELSGVTFSQIAGFRGTTFYELAEFSNAKLEGHTTFADAKFKKYTPHFYNAKLSADIIWERYFKFWPQLKEYTHVLKKPEINEILRINQNAYENLAYQMKDSEKYHDEHFFFRQEMRCRQKLEHFLIKPFYWLYEGLSNYGYGVGWAILWWALHSLGGATILFSIRSVDRWNMSWEDFGCSLGISLSNSHAFFFKGDRLEKCYGAFEYLPAFNVVWGVQTITGTLLIFLVLLTLRVRFRLK